MKKETMANGTVYTIKLSERTSLLFVKFKHQFKMFGLTLLDKHPPIFISCGQANKFKYYTFDLFGLGISLHIEDRLSITSGEPSK